MKTAFSVPLNPALKDLPVYQPGRPINEVAREMGLEPGEIIKLASNENPLGPSPKAIEAMRDALPTLHLYPDGNVFYLKQRLAEILDVTPDHLIFGNGSNEIIQFVGHACMAPGTEVIVSQYCFAIYPIITSLFGATLVTVPAKQFGHDIPAMLAAVNANTRVMFVAAPNNPTGTLPPREDIIRLLNEIPPHVLLVMDEAYIEFLKDPVNTLALVRNGEKPNLLLMRTFSKVFGLAGLRIGYGIGHPDLIKAFEKVRQPFNINTLAQVAALAALDDKAHLAATRANNEQGLEYYNLAFRQLELKFIPSHANFILVRVGDAPRIFVELQKRGIITRPMGGYGLPEWLRISVGDATENAHCIVEFKKIIGR
ncbi:MAG TPA: histidinol-phosphate transaminase [Roseimicrobium sp.]|nr:histidinol-phosphate transaminase [Roseimicrobium sp.]